MHVCSTPAHNEMPLCTSRISIRIDSRYIIGAFGVSFFFSLSPFLRFLLSVAKLYSAKKGSVQRGWRVARFSPGVFHFSFCEISAPRFSSNERVSYRYDTGTYGVNFLRSPLTLRQTATSRVFVFTLNSQFNFKTRKAARLFYSSYEKCVCSTLGELLKSF